MNEHDYFRINKPEVSAEVFDGEIVIINFRTGNYYSLEEAGSEIWKLVHLGVDRTGIKSAMIRLFKGDPEAVGTAVDRLLTELAREGIILKAGEKQPTGEPESAPDYGLQKDQLTWNNDAAFLHKYSDMQDLLLLDPIHEVDENGWPHGKSEGKD